MDCGQNLSLPKDIAWKLIAVSPDMMDTKFCNKRFPFAWRSSLAISAYEPSPDELPVELSEDRITYLKVTCTITGYQPSEEETKRGFVSFPTVPTEDLKRILGEYFACYGVLLNVAVFPHSDFDTDDVKDYPHIIDFEPKKRDLYQAATESGEILTASVSDVKTDKTLVHTTTTQTGLSLDAKYKAKSEQGEVEIGGKLSHGWGETDQDRRTVQTEASRDRREKEGATTSLSQMYNLLTGYHVGTNRATFLMLPRPHVKQPTEHRTFVQGLRMIEGVQDFFLIVARPKDMERFCVEAFLETGHFPEKVDIKEPKEEYTEDKESFWVIKYGDWGTWGSDPVHIDTQYTVTGGWVIDRDKGDSGHAGISMVEDNSNQQAKDSLQDYNYTAKGDSTVEVEGTIEGHSNFFTGTGASFKRRYEVYTKKQKPKPPSSLPKVTSKFIITSRWLCTCLPEPPFRLLELVGRPSGDWIVDCPIIEISQQLQDSALTEEVLKQVQFAMTTSWRLPTRQPFGEVGFLDSDFFKDQIQQIMPDDVLETPLSNVSDLPQGVVESFGATCTIAEALKMDISSFTAKTGLSLREAVRARNRLLGIEHARNSYEEV